MNRIQEQMYDYDIALEQLLCAEWPLQILLKKMNFWCICSVIIQM